MAPLDTSDTAPPQPHSSFVTTHWSVVLKAGRPNLPGAAESLETLCAAYWYPLYAHVRRRGHDAEAARDLTQGFFAELLSRQSIGSADPNRGRFRTFLLTALDNFLHHQHRDANALKRGGGKEFISWDAQEAEDRFGLEPADHRSPELDFDRRWAMATMETARERLRRELLLSSKGELFERLSPHVFNASREVSYAEIASQLQMTVVAVKVTVHRLRHRYGEILRQEVAQTLADPADAKEEIHHLIAALGEKA